MPLFQPSRLFEVFDYQNEYFPNKNAITSWNGKTWESHSTLECIRDIHLMANGIKHLDLEVGARVGILSHMGSYPWVVTDLALQMIGLIPVPLHASYNSRQLGYIIKEAEIDLCFIQNCDEGKVLINIKDSHENLTLFSFTQEENIPSWKSLFKPFSDEEFKKLKEFASAINSDSLATIIYTSGTTGNPKGVMLSHKNIISNILSTIVLIPVSAEDRTLSYLPMSHIFERMVVYSYIMTGCSIYFAKNVTTILEDLNEVKPNYFTTVPRLLERVHEIIVKSATSGNFLKKKIITWALRLGEKVDDSGKIKPMVFIQRFFADILVYRVWRKKIGGEVKGVIVGAAALQPRLGKLFSFAKIKIREGYGLTETSPVISFNRFEPGGNIFGTVGIPIPGVDVKIANQNEKGIGEILVKGPNVMMGYYKNEERTKKVLTEDGWFSTGDTGQMTNKRYLKISGRKKDIFKTSTGKYVAPFHVENVLKNSDFVSQCMVLGANKSFPGALLIPNFERLKSWCEINGVHWTSPQYMVHNPLVISHFQEIIKFLNFELSKEERVRRFFLLYNEWAISTGEYGPTLKLLRPVIVEKYKSQIEEMFGPKGLTVFVK